MFADLVLFEMSMRSRWDSLSRRERDVALAYASGASYKEVARSLALAPATVRHHLRAAYRKLQVSSKAALIKAVEKS